MRSNCKNLHRKFSLKTSWGVEILPLAAPKDVMQREMENFGIDFNKTHRVVVKNTWGFIDIIKLFSHITYQITGACS